MSIVKEIHAKIDKHTNRAYAESVLQNLPFDVYLKDKHYLELWDEYKRAYPDYPFMPWSSIAELAAEYNLVVGPEFLFQDEIPTEGQLASKLFKLHPYDQYNQHHAFGLMEEAILYGKGSVFGGHGGIKLHKPLEEMQLVPDDGSQPKGFTLVDEITYNPFPRLGWDQIKKLYAARNLMESADMLSYTSGRTFNIRSLETHYGENANHTSPICKAEIDVSYIGFRKGIYFTPLSKHVFFILQHEYVEDDRGGYHHLGFGHGLDSGATRMRNPQYVLRASILVQNVHKYGISYRQFPIESTLTPHLQSRVGFDDFSPMARYECSLTLDFFALQKALEQACYGTFRDDAEMRWNDKARLPQGRLIMGANTMFDTQIMKQDGHLIYVDGDKMMKEGVNLMHLNDPAILQPVRGGCLVLHKWGELKDVPMA